MTFTGTLLRAGDNLVTPHSHFYRGVFGRLFPNLPPWQPKGTTEQERLDHLGDLASKMTLVDGPDNPAIPAGYTYLGQCINHDLTFDAVSTLEEKNEPLRLLSLRTPRFDLDSVYGRGPADQPYLYDAERPSELLVGKNAREERDLPRNQQGRAIIGDGRNDENIMVAQLHLAFLLFHNKAVRSGMSFEVARQYTRWHYQWIAIHDFLARLCGRDLVQELLGQYGRPNLRFYNPVHQPFIPVEFSVAGYRVGHSMVRPSYHLNDHLEAGDGRPIPIFVKYQRQTGLAGGRVLPSNWTIQWDRFVEWEDQSKAQMSKLLDTHIARPLATLHFPDSEAPALPYFSLSFRTLLRGWRMALPSGQSVARRMGEWEIVDEDEDDPLWLYLLKEAEQLKEGGQRLGPVGARLVGEVFVGLLAADPLSYYCVAPNWTPEIPTLDGDFELRDFLRYAEVPLSRDDWLQRPGA